MKTLPKTIRPHTAVQYRVRNRDYYAEHTPSCVRGKQWVEVAIGYDHEQQVFVKRRVAVHQIVALGERARKPMTPQDYLVNGSKHDDEVKKIEVMKKRYPKNFQPRDRTRKFDAELRGEREIEFHMTKGEQRRWLKQSEKRRNNSPLPPADVKPRRTKASRRPKRRFHKAASVSLIIPAR